MHTTSASDRAGDLVYQAIKAKVIAYEFPQGKRIYLDSLAKELGVSTTAVREALIRLAVEGLVTGAARTGFLAMTLDEEALRGRYELTRQLLTQGLDMLGEEARRELPKCEAIAGVLNKLRRRELSDVKVLAACTGQIFEGIAALTENPNAIHAIGATNDRLFFIRTRECQHFDDVRKKLILFCELLLSERCEALIAALHDYHDRRIELLPTLFPTLL